ncbi:hypothetical protein DLM85_24560 [Hymenobacter edaphi]|uniref:Uncharacterized protein n=1 Tax=Hymenobacter edaphi TaxID=2211146 RepID=A0A328B3Q1_9BACT|nr:hypothetical protein DLM85_24560 [Hymenobacter edaphi]
MVEGNLNGIFECLIVNALAVDRVQEFLHQRDSLAVHSELDVVAEGVIVKVNGSDDALTFVSVVLGVQVGHVDQRDSRELSKVLEVCQTYATGDVSFVFTEDDQNLQVWIVCMLVEDVSEVIIKLDVR